METLFLHFSGLILVTIFVTAYGQCEITNGRAYESNTNNALIVSWNCDLPANEFYVTYRLLDACDTRDETRMPPFDIKSRGWSTNTIDFVDKIGSGIYINSTYQFTVESRKWDTDLDGFVFGTPVVFNVTTSADLFLESSLISEAFMSQTFVTSWNPYPNQCVSSKSVAAYEYQLIYTHGDDGIVAKSGVTNSTAITIPNLECDTAYRFLVTYLTDSGTGSESWEFGKTNLYVPPHPIVSLLSSENTSLSFTWTEYEPCNTKNEIVTKYFFELKTNNGGSVFQGAIANTSVSFSSLIPYQEYWMRVQVRIASPSGHTLQSGWGDVRARTVPLTTTPATLTTVPLPFDVDPLIATCPADITAIVPISQTGSLVYFDDPDVRGGLPGYDLSCSPSSDSFIFPLGLTAVTCTVIDANGFKSSCQFGVEIIVRMEEIPLPTDGPSESGVRNFRVQMDQNKLITVAWNFESDVTSEFQVMYQLIVDNQECSSYNDDFRTTPWTALQRVYLDYASDGLYANSSYWITVQEREWYENGTVIYRPKHEGINITTYEESVLSTRFVTSNTAKITWNDYACLSDDSTTYEYQLVENDGQVIKQGTSIIGNILLSGLDCNSEYSFRRRALTPMDTEPWDHLSFNTELPDSSPINIAIKNQTKHSLTFKWNFFSQCNKENNVKVEYLYELERNGINEKVGAVPDPEVDFSDLQESKLYRFRVRGYYYDSAEYHDGKYSDWSKWVDGVTDIIRCVSSPCVNGGLCTEGVNGYTCTCLDGYQGEHCEIDTDECASSPCLNHGGCIDGINSYSCQCSTGFTDDICETDINECLSFPCRHGGVCSDGVDGYTCSCLTGYEGTFCERNTDECDTEPCLNDGLCIDGINSFLCQCPSGWTGDTCQTDVNECISFPCRNGGACVDSVNGYSCSCLQGYEGGLCETNTDECDPAPCFNDGRCIDGINSFSCLCPAGWTGDTCQTDIDECTSYPCLGGVCVDDVNGYHCSCLPGYDGARCEIKLKVKLDYDVVILIIIVAVLGLLVIIVVLITVVQAMYFRRRLKTFNQGKANEYETTPIKLGKKTNFDTNSTSQSEYQNMYGIKEVLI